MHPDRAVCHNSSLKLACALNCPDSACSSAMSREEGESCQWTGAFVTELDAARATGITCAGQPVSIPDGWCASRLEVPSCRADVSAARAGKGSPPKARSIEPPGRTFHGTGQFIQRELQTRTNCRTQTDELTDASDLQAAPPRHRPAGIAAAHRSPAPGAKRPQLGPVDPSSDGNARDLLAPGLVRAGR